MRSIQESYPGGRAGTKPQQQNQREIMFNEIKKVHAMEPVTVLTVL